MHRKNDGKQQTAEQSPDGECSAVFTCFFNLRSFLPVCQNRNFAVDVVIAFGTVGHQAVGAIFDAVFGIAAVSTAVVPQSVQRTVAEQAIKSAAVLYLVAGEIPAIFVLKNDVNFPCFYLNS